MTTSTVVLLYDLSGLVLIIPAKTGIVYRQQSGGYACYQTELEGYLVPIAGNVTDACQRLEEHFLGPKWGGWSSEGIDEETAEEIDRLLAEVFSRGHVKVDRSRLKDSWESWVHVTMEGDALSLINQSSPRSAILTWPNSD